MEKGGKNENGRVSSLESVPILLNPTALRMAKAEVLAILSAIGLKEVTLFNSVSKNLALIILNFDSCEQILVSIYAVCQQC